jgi:hypothetical protein
MFTDYSLDDLVAALADLLECCAHSGSASQCKLGGLLEYLSA